MATKLLKAKIKQFKAIKDFEADVDGQNFWLVADNDYGKTSFMTFLKASMGDFSGLPEGIKSQGEFWLDKDGKKYHSKIEQKNGKTILKVTYPDGHVEEKKTIIRALFGGVDFDIEKFVNDSKTAEGRRNQVQTFKEMLAPEDLQILINIENEIKKVYDDRTEITKKIDALSGFIKECKLFGDELNTQPVDVTALNAELQKANEFNQKIKDVKTRIENRAKSIIDREKDIENKNKLIADKEAEIERIKAEIVGIKSNIVDLDAALITEKQVQRDAEKWVAEKGIPMDTASIMAALNSASETNIKASKAADQKEKIAKLESYQAIHQDYTVEIELKREAIRECIRSIESPVKGLSYEDETLIYNGVPVNNESLSTSQKLELGAKMHMAKNPDCGMLLLEHGESIGTKRLQLILDLAKQNNWQVIAEQVVRGKETLEAELMIEP